MAIFFSGDESLKGLASKKSEVVNNTTQSKFTELIILATAWYEHLMSGLNAELLDQEVEFGLIDDSNFRIKPFPEIFFRIHRGSVLAKTADIDSLTLFTENINPKPINLTKDQTGLSQFSELKDIGSTSTLEKILLVNDSLVKLVMEDDDVDFDFIKLDKMMTISKRRIYGRDQFGNILVCAKNRFVKQAMEMESEESEASNSVKTAVET